MEERFTSFASTVKRMTPFFTHFVTAIGLTEEFYSEVIKWFNKENAASFSLSPTEILFGKAPFKTDPPTKNLNRTLLFAKYYLYTQKLAQKKYIFRRI